MYIALLGRQPEISIAELAAVFGADCVHRISQQFAEVQTSQFDITTLGGIIKCAEVISELPASRTDKASLLAASRFITQHYQAKWEHSPHKITLGLSAYNLAVGARDVQKTGLILKSSLKKSGTSLRLIPNDQPALSTATVLHNKLAIGNPKKVELLLTPAPGSHRLVVAKAIYVQDIGAYTLRDRGRPRRDTRNGMLPPKLAQTMINLARGACQLTRPTNLLDPFCGTGVILQEAGLMGLTTYGSDNNPRMIEYTQTNLDWLARRYRQASRPHLTVADATDFSWQQWLAPDRLELVASETYLGRPYTSPPHLSELKSNLHDCNVIIGKFITNLSPQLPSGTGVCLGVPAWYIRDHIHHLPCLAELPRHKLRSITAGANLIYHRPDQVVGRELLVLQKA